jgi:hypothetical protein
MATRPVLFALMMSRSPVEGNEQIFCAGRLKRLLLFRFG